jgi:hypothetical protein
MRYALATPAVFRRKVRRVNLPDLLLSVRLFAGRGEIRAVESTPNHPECLTSFQEMPNFDKHLAV